MDVLVIQLLTPAAVVPTPARLPELLRSAVHLWYFRRSEQQGVPMTAITAVLHASEVAHAGRYARVADQEHYLWRRAFVRVVLSSYLGAEPRQLRFASETYGKPCLVGIHTDGLVFNLSQSQGNALLAVTRGAAIGVDLEQSNHGLNTASMRRMVLSQAEATALSRLDEGAQAAFFLRLWTRKEALLKALGTGLVDDLTAISVIGDVVATADLAKKLALNQAPSLIYLQDLQLTDGSIAAIGTSERPLPRVFTYYNNVWRLPLNAKPNA